jgi:putative transposase
MPSTSDYGFCVRKMEILKGYKYRLFPNKEQKQILENHFGACRWIYNYGLEKKIEYYKNHKDDEDKKKRSLNKFTLQKELPFLKKDEKTKWLGEVNSQALVGSLNNLDYSYKNFFREKRGFPKFKNKNSKQSFSMSQLNKIDWDNNYAIFCKIGKIKAKFHRKFEGDIMGATISKNCSNQYFVVYKVRENKELPKLKKVKEKTTIGIDLGIKTFATISDGRKIDNPKFLRNSEERLKVLARRLSKKKKGSNNRKKAKLKVAKLHNKITNQRSDFLHKITYQLTHESQVDSIAIEDLNVKGMVKNHCLAKSISDVSWSEFVRQLKYKCEWYGKNLLIIGRFEPSSKMCSCGEVNKNLSLSDREWACSKCGTKHDRDLLASNNIKKFALSGRLPSVEPVELSTLVGAVKQEKSLKLEKTTV